MHLGPRGSRESPAAPLPEPHLHGGQLPPPLAAAGEGGGGGAGEGACCVDVFGGGPRAGLVGHIDQPRHTGRAQLGDEGRDVGQDLCCTYK